MRTSIVYRLIHSKKFRWAKRKLSQRTAYATRAAAGVAVLAGGMAFVGAPAESQAIELISNGGFESNDGFNGNNVGFDWDNADGPPNFDVYSHSTQVYYEGAAPTGAGDWYFHKVGVPGGVTTQSIDLTANFATSAIDAGTLQFDYSGYLSGFTPQQDHATLQLSFLDGNGAQIGGVAASMDGGAPLAGDGQSIEFDDPDSFVAFADPSFSPTVVANFPTNPTAAWKLYRDVAGVPVGSRTALVSILENGNDSYVDLVSLDIADTGQEQFMSVVVNKTTGTVSFTNGSAAALDMNFYQLGSDAGLLSSGWNSLADQMVDSQGPNPEDNWLEGGGSNQNLLTEVFLHASNLGIGETISMTNAYTGGEGGTEDITFQYGLDDGSLLSGIVKYMINLPGGPGDFDSDTDVDGTDLLLLQRGFPATYDAGDFNDWEENYGTGFPSAGAAASVPEPVSVLLAGCGLACLSGMRRRR